MFKTFAEAVKTSLRSDPDLVLVGEMRDRASMKAGLEVALTGHGAFSTMHTTSVVQTVTRFLQSFDKEEVAAVQYDLVDNLHMIMSQLLREGPDGRRVALRERLSFDGQIKDRLRSAKNLSHELRQVMESYGRLMVDEARDIYKEGRLTKEALERLEWMDMKERSSL
jgi:defect-in-organelle-trafficking protein DotB